ncbi:MAG: peptide chain release factor 1 [Clostridia bacterium]|nr:peptide chain release factor 1 [Clostridia bacterium]
MLQNLQAAEFRYEELTKKLTDPEILGDPSEYRKVLTEHAELSELIEAYREYKSKIEERDEAKELLSEPLDEDFKKLVSEEYNAAIASVKELEAKLRELLMPKDPNDDKNVIVEIRGGAGGEEAALFGAVLFRMYSKFAEKNGWRVEIIDSNETEIGGLKEMVFSIEGKGVYSKMKFESGVHRVQRVPSTESGGRIHTSTATVAVLPEADEVDYELNLNDVEIDTYRSGGAGGQHINKTDSAIRLTHKPTGIVVTCQDQRSQLKNKEKAFKVLRTKLLDMYQGQQINEIAEDRKNQVGTGDRSERIRTYNYPQNRVTDHRIELTLYKLTEILEGSIDEIVDALITNDRAKKLAEGNNNGTEDVF